MHYAQAPSENGYWCNACVYGLSEFEELLTGNKWKDMKF